MPAPTQDIAAKIAAAWVTLLGGIANITNALGTVKDGAGATVTAVNAVKLLDTDSVNSCRPCVLVGYNPATQPLGKGTPLYVVPVLIQCLTARDVDTAHATLDAIYANVEAVAMAVINGTTSLTAVTGYTYGGFVLNTTATDAPDGSHGKSITIECHFKTS